MKDGIKQFWVDRAEKHIWQGTLGKWQATSLTKSEEAAVKRRNAEIKKIKKALSFIEEADGMNLLDVGCGTGKLTVFLANNFSHVYATHYINEFLAVAKQEAAGQQIENVTFKNQRADEPYEDIEFDCCFFSGILQYLTDEEYHRALELVKPAKFFIVKESGGVNERIELKEHYSEELKASYSAIYRQKDQIIEDFKNLGCEVLMDELIEEHRKETNIRIFVFKKS